MSAWRTVHMKSKRVNRRTERRRKISYGGSDATFNRVVCRKPKLVVSEVRPLSFADGNVGLQNIVQPLPVYFQTPCGHSQLGHGHWYGWRSWTVNHECRIFVSDSLGSPQI